jgi:hypothetical protein
MILLSGKLTSVLGGRVSTGLMHATPGEMKSLRSSADRIALITFTLTVCALAKTIGAKERKETEERYPRYSFSSCLLCLCCLSSDL